MATSYRFPERWKRKKLKPGEKRSREIKYNWNGNRSENGNGIWTGTGPARAMPKTANLGAEQESANAGENNANANVNARNAHITHLFIYQSACVCVCACVRESVRVLACSEAWVWFNSLLRYAQQVKIKLKRICSPRRTRRGRREWRGRSGNGGRWLPAHLNATRPLDFACGLWALSRRHK